MASARAPGRARRPSARAAGAVPESRRLGCCRRKQTDRDGPAAVDAKQPSADNDDSARSVNSRPRSRIAPGTSTARAARALPGVAASFIPNAEAPRARPSALSIWPLHPATARWRGAGDPRTPHAERHSLRPAGSAGRLGAVSSVGQGVGQLHANRAVRRPLERFQLEGQPVEPCRALEGECRVGCAAAAVA